MAVEVAGCCMTCITSTQPVARIPVSNRIHLEHTCFKKGERISLLSNASSICNLFIQQREGETVSKKGKERTIKVNSVEAFWWLRQVVPQSCGQPCSRWGKRFLGGLHFVTFWNLSRQGNAVLSEININSCYDTIRCLLLKIMKWFQWLCDIPWNEQNW